MSTLSRCSIYKIGLALLFIMMISITIRYPYLYYNHESGADSFFYHRMANVILSFHEATWFLHPLSLWGLYPYSDSPASPFYVAEISSLGHISVEHSIIIYDYIFVIAGIFGAFLFGLKIKRSVEFASFLAIAISLAPKAFTPTLFSLDERVALVLMLPMWFLLIYYVISANHKSNGYKYWWFILITFTFLLSTVHLAFIFATAFVVGYFIYIILKHFVHKVPKVIRLYRPLWVFLIFVILFYSMFVISSFVKIPGFNIDMYKKTALFSGTDPITIALNIMVSITGGTGILFIIFGIPGGVLMILKRRLSHFETWFLISLLSLSPFLINRLYIRPFLVSVIAILIGYGALFFVIRGGNILRKNIKKDKQTLKIAFVALFITSIIIGASFAGYMNYRWDKSVENSASKIPHGMMESTYAVAVWMKSILKFKTIYITNHEVVGGRVEAYSNRIMLPGIYVTDMDNIVFYKLYNNKSELGITINNGISKGPYTADRKLLDVIHAYFQIMGNRYPSAIHEIEKYNVSYFLYFTKYGPYMSGYYDKKLYKSAFCKSTPEYTYAVFKNKDYSFFYLEYSNT